MADVSTVSAPTGTFVSGNLLGPPAAPAGMACGSAFLTVDSTAPLYSPASNTQLDQIHQVGPPAGAARAGDRVGADQSRQRRRDHPAPADRAGLIAFVTFPLLFLLTGSAVIALQAVVCNLLSLMAAFGAMVWIFQDGRLGALGTTPNGTLNAQHPSVVVLHRLWAGHGLRGVLGLADS